MATVIDSLLIELGLDNKKFSAAAKQSINNLRKLEAQARKSFKSTQNEANNLEDSFGKAKDALLSLGVSLVGFKGLTNLAQQVTTVNADISRTASRFKMSAAELSAWGQLMKSVGGTAEDFTSSMQAVDASIANIKLKGSAAIFENLAQLQRAGADIRQIFNPQTGKFDWEELADQVKYLVSIGKEQEAFITLSDMGITEKYFQVLKKGGDEVRRMRSELERLQGVNEKNSKQAEELQEKWGKVSTAFGGAANQIMNQLYPSLGKLADGTTTAVTKFTEWDKQLNGGLSNVLIFDAGLITLMTTLKALGITFTAQTAIVAAWALKLEAAAPILGKVVGAAGLLFHSGELNKGEDEEIRKIHAEQDKASGKTGGKSKQGNSNAGPSGLPRNLRNNNPGNIEYGNFAKKQGATGSDGRFAIFPDMKTGENAMANLLMSYAKGGTNTISSIISKWSPAGENGTANTNSYIANVAKATGIDPNKALNTNELLAVQRAMTNQEGMIGPRATVPQTQTASNNSNVQTSINTVNIQTQATDADGIFKDMYAAFESNTLMNYGTVGYR
jgi:hypothetical protein